MQWVFPGIIIGILLALVAFGLAMTFGLLRFVNFAHGDLLTIGAYLAYSMNHILRWPLLLAAFTAVVLTGMLAMGIERIAFRPLATRRMAMFVSSFGVSLILNALITLAFGSTSVSLVDSGILKIGSWHLILPEVVALASLPVAALTLTFLARKTSFGVAARAIAENRTLLDLNGVSSRKIVTWTFFVSGALAGFAGVLFAALYGLSPQMGYHYGLWAFLVIILAGFGSMSGIGWAALTTGLLISMTMYYTRSYTAVHAVVFSLMAMVLFIRPRGIFGQALRQV